MLTWLLNLLFPPKCVLCQRLLTKEQTYFCPACRVNAPEFSKSNFAISFVADWTGVWYYKDIARKSLIRYKFRGQRSYVHAYAQVLALKLRQEQMDHFDVLTFVPIAPLRRFMRGYDQVEILADALGKELGIPATRTLRKTRNTPPQSGLRDVSRRRANVLGAYRVPDADLIKGKRVMLLDDVITTGATASECARMLLSSGAKEVICAALGVAYHNKK
jgi:ComF family protein